MSEHVHQAETDVIRPRTDADMDDLVRIAERVQHNDGYPGHTPRDFKAFVAAPDALGAWVAADKKSVIGHVALHNESLPVVMDLAATHLGTRDLAVVARLIVDPDARGTGVGRALLETAAHAAWEHNKTPILDVVTHYAAANALYTSCGWRNIGEVTMAFRDGTTLQSYVYVAPIQ